MIGLFAKTGATGMMFVLIVSAVVLFSEDGFSQDGGEDHGRGQKKAPESLISPQILNNDRLRSHYYKEFRDRYYYSPSPTYFTDLFVDNWVDQQIIHNAETISEEITNLRIRHGMGLELLKRNVREPERSEIKREIRQFFKNFREDTGNLRERIQFIVSGLDSKPENEYQNYSIERDSANHRMELAGKELEEAERLIRNYFLKPTHTVSVSDLNENNMMIRLYRIEKIMESLEKTAF